MQQLILVVACFGIIPLLSRTKISFGVKLFITMFLVSALNGLTPGMVFDNFLGIFRSPASVEVILVVSIIGIINGLMNKYGIFDKIVSDLSAITKNVKILFIFLPSFIGLLTMPGGAVMSAPFISNLGEQVGMPKPRRAAVNLIFRHSGMYFMPYSGANLLLHAFFPEISIYKFIGMNSIFLFGMWIYAYFLYLHDIPVEKSVPTVPREETFAKIKSLAVNLSPIYICIALNILLGLRFSVCLIASIAIIYFLGPRKGFVKLLFKSIDKNLILAMVAIFFVQQTVLSLDGLIGFFSAMFHSGGYSLLAILLVSVFFGMITGVIMAPFGVILPLVASLGLSENELMAYVYFIFATGFCGYFFSPLHLCQVLTNNHMGVTTCELWKEYRYFVLFTVVFLGVSFFVIRMIFV